MSTYSHAQNYKKHSLYGFEDRVVIDPGSRIWKIGFSGESEPRKVFWPCNVSEDEMWDLDLSKMVEEMKGRNTFIPSQVEEDVEEWDEDEKEMWNLIRARVLRAFKDAFIK
jgi:actin-related protein 10